MMEHGEIKNIVFVLGAGASKPFNFPLGNELILNIIKGINEGNYNRIQETFSALYAYRNRNHAPTHYDFFQSPYSAFYSAINYSDNRSSIQEYDKKYGISLRDHKYHATFAELLNSKTASSIDYVLNENPSYSFIGRAYIALEMLRAYRGLSDEWGTKIHPDHERYKKLAPEYPENWYISLAEFIKKLGENADSLKALYDGYPVRFVTFNYDMSLEHYFSQFFDGEIYKNFDVNQIISNIFHVYGKIDFCTKENGQHLNADKDIIKLIFSQAENVSLIRKSPDQTDEIKKIRQYITNADVICILGFAFDLENLKIIGLDAAMKENLKKIYVHNFDNNERISRIAQGSNNIFIKTGSIKNIFQSDFISPDICMKEPLVMPYKYRESVI